MNPEIERLVRAIDEHPDKAHSDWTPAVRRLVEIGRPALGPALELMESDRYETRLRAQRVLEGVTMAVHGFRPGQGWAADDGEARWRRAWDALGALDAAAPADERRRAAALWRRWLVEDAG